MLESVGDDGYAEGVFLRVADGEADAVDSDGARAGRKSYLKVKYVEPSASSTSTQVAVVST